MGATLASVTGLGLDDGLRAHACSPARPFAFPRPLRRLALTLPLAPPYEHAHARRLLCLRAHACSPARPPPSPPHKCTAFPCPLRHLAHLPTTSTTRAREHAQPCRPSCLRTRVLTCSPTHLPSGTVAQHCSGGVITPVTLALASAYINNSTTHRIARCTTTRARKGVRENVRHLEWAKQEAKHDGVDPTQLPARECTLS